MFRGHVRQAVSGARAPHSGARVRAYSQHGLGRIRTVRDCGLAFPLPEPERRTPLRSAAIRVALALLVAALATTRLHFKRPAEASWFPVPITSTSIAHRG